MTRRTMSAWGISLAVGLALSASPPILRGQFGGRGVKGPDGSFQPSGPASEVAQLAQENRDRRQVIQAKARDLVARLNERAREQRESLRKTEAEIAAASDLLAEIDRPEASTPSLSNAARRLETRLESRPEATIAPPMPAFPAQAEPIAVPLTGPPAPPSVAPRDDTAGWEYSNNLAWGWATAADPTRRDGPKALEFAKKACELTGDQNPLCLDTLAAAYAEVGNFAQAIAVQARAVQVGGADHADDFKARLRLYIDAKPYHEPAPAPR